MKLWVYICKDEKKDLKISLSTSIDNIIPFGQFNQAIVYLCPFEVPFDAIAHKHLLD